MPSRSPTIKDVARAAGVSTATVSLVLSGRADAIGISAGCIARVREVAARLGYERNYHASSLSRSQGSLTIGLCGPATLDGDSISTFWSTITAGVEQAAYDLGYDVLNIGGDAGRDTTTRALQHLHARRVDALVIYNAMFLFLPPQMATTTAPMVFIMGQPANFDRSVIDFDAVPGLIQAAQHLKHLGHQRVMYLAVHMELAPWLEGRIATFAAAGAQCGLDVETRMLHSRTSEAPNVDHLRRTMSTLELPPDVTAVVCATDYIAHALYDVLRQRGIRVPQDLSVIGFDDLDRTYFHPQLTTISHHLHQIGSEGSRLAIRLKSGEATDPTRIVVASSLQIRESTCAPSRR